MNETRVRGLPQPAATVRALDQMPMCRARRVLRRRAGVFVVCCERASFFFSLFVVTHRRAPDNVKATQTRATRRARLRGWPARIRCRCRRREHCAVAAGGSIRSAAPHPLVLAAAFLSALRTTLADHMRRRYVWSPAPLPPPPPAARTAWSRVRACLFPGSSLTRAVLPTSPASFATQTTPHTHTHTHLRLNGCPERAGGPGLPGSA